MRATTCLLPLLLAGLVFVGIVLGGGCAKPPLRDERRVEPYASLLRAADAQGTIVTRVNAAEPGEPALHLSLVQRPRTARGTGPLLVFQPGVLADHRTWRALAPALASHYDVLLVDPPGCGASDKPPVGRLGPDAYSPAWLGRHTLRAIQRWETRTGSAGRRLVLIGHSLGGTAILLSLGDPDLPADLERVAARVERLVLIQPADIAMAEPSQQFELGARIGDGAVATADALGILRRQINRGIWESVTDPCRGAHCQEAQRIHRVIRCDATRRSAQAMMIRLRKVDACGEPDWTSVRRLEMRYANVTQPTLILWGSQDEVLDIGTGPKLRDALPHARLEFIGQAKHSPHQERPLVCRDWIRLFLEGDGGTLWSARPRPVHSD